MHPNELESLNYGLVPPLFLGLCPYLGLGLGLCLGFGYHWFHFAYFLQHLCFPLKLKQKIQKCFKIALFDLIQQFLLNSF